MSRSTQEPCPQCAQAVEIMVAETATEETVVPKFCGWCGASLHGVCPACSFKLMHLFAFCPQCRQPLTERLPGEPRRAGAAAVPPVEALEPQRACLLQLRHDLGAMEAFSRALFDILIQLNPVKFRGSQFSAQINHITAETSALQDSTTLERALTRGDLSDIGESMDRYTVAVLRAVSDLTTHWYPPLQEALQLHTDPTLPAPLLAGLSTALRSKEKLMNELRSLFLELKQGLPRVQKIAASSRLWQFVTDLTVATIVGGAAAPEVLSLTQSLRDAGGKSDQEYLEAYQNILGRAVEAWNGFGEQLEQATAPALDAIFSHLHEGYGELLQELTRLAAAGMDVTPAAASLQLAWRPAEAWQHDFVDAVLEELEKRGTAAPVLERLRALCDDGRPWQAETWPEQELLAQLAATMKRETLLAETIRGILGSPFPSCHLAPEIPETKLQKVLSTYAQGVDPNRVVFLYDDTAFGGAKEGCSLTVDELFWHNLMEPAHREPLQDIRTICRGQGPHLEVDGQQLDVYKEGLPERIMAILTAARDQARAAHEPSAPAEPRRAA